jgi:HK97 family phage portal protein
VTILSRAIRNSRAMMRAQEWGDSSIPPNSSLSSIGSALGGGEAGALAIGTVLACVKALFDDTQVLPFAAYQGERDGAHQRIAKQPRIVTEPFGPDLEPSLGYGQLVVSKVFRGNAFCYVVSRDPVTLLPDQLAILHPDTVRADRDKNKGLFYRVAGQEFGPDEIIHLRGLMMPGSISGVDVLTYQRMTHDLAFKVNQYADSFFGNGGSPAGVINVANERGDRKRAREVRDMWDANHSGPMNAHRPAVLFGDRPGTAHHRAGERAVP